MSKSSSRTRVAKPVRVSPLLARYVPAAGPVAPAAAATRRAPLISKTIFGVTIHRYLDGVELIHADGRKLTASSPWGLLFKMFKGKSK